ncbi:MAG: hypothetical protein JNN30_13995 [Rhodanobacteraceae bacterium]|jgi:hypothetical protein|nr:hypothetical protein [Rhodanobacteraceae bacterium]
MARLAIEDAPAPSTPRRFLLAVPYWGMAAGALLLTDAAALLHTRWHPATLAATHAFTLGVMGNLLVGSLLQFLPAAAGVRLRGAACGGLLCLLFNCGILLLTSGLYLLKPLLLTAAAAALALAFSLLAVMTGPGLLTACGQGLLRAGLSAALLAALVTAAGGVLLALALSNWLAAPWSVPVLTDVHAAWGIAGWVLLTLGSVSRVVMPMFLGTAVTPPRLQMAWTAATVLLLVAASILLLAGGSAMPLRLSVAGAALAFASAALQQQLRTAPARNAPLRAWWRSGLLALTAFALVLPWQLRGDLLAGVLGIAVALPLLTVGMQLEIVAFLGWLDLHRRYGHGTRLPSVHRLLPDADKWRVLCGFLAAVPLQLAAVLKPSTGLARAAGLALLIAYTLLWHALGGVRRRSARFVAQKA